MCKFRFHAGSCIMSSNRLDEMVVMEVTECTPMQPIPKLILLMVAKLQLHSVVFMSIYCNKNIVFYDPNQTDNIEVTWVECFGKSK